MNCEIVEVRDSAWERSKRRLHTFLYSGHMMLWGLFCAALGGESLVPERWPLSPWRVLLGFALLLSYVWELIALRPWDDREPSTYEAGIALLAALLTGLLVVFRAHDWAVVTLGVVWGMLFWIVGRRRKRTYLLAVAGWLAAGFVAVRSQWPGDQRLGLLFVIGGLATALQGVWEIPYSRKNLHFAPGSPATDPGDISSGVLR